MVLVEKYTRERDRFEKLSAFISRQLSAALRNASVPHVPTYRSKDPASLQGKLVRDRDEHDFALLEREFAPGLLDLAGVRILLYRPRDIMPACATIAELFTVPDGEPFRRDHENPIGYQARHRVVMLKDDQIGLEPAFANLRHIPCEIQVATIGDHIWNELEHDIKYKTPHGQPTEGQTAFLQSLRTQLDGVRSTVNRLMDATERQRAENATSIESADAVQLALRTRSERLLAGDFDRLLDLLDGVLREVTAQELHKLPLGAAELGAAQTMLERTGIAISENDVGLVVAALWHHYGEEFVEAVNGWAGRPGRLKRLIRDLDRAKNEGRL